MFGFLKNKYFWFMLAIIIATLTVVHQTAPERTDVTIIEKMVRNAYTPLQRGVSAFRGYLGGLEDIFADKRQLVADMKRLEEELNSYRLENQGLREYRYEARRLKELLDFRDQNLTNMEVIAAQVIARDPNAWYNTITIDQGSDRGISPNMAVITPSGLVGRVTTVSSNYAVVILITDREGAVGATVQETRVPGIIMGTVEAGKLQLNHIPFYSEVKKGNRVVTSPFSGLYPPGIMIGAIEEVSAEPEGLTRKATVIPAVDFDQLEEVLVVKEYINPAAEWGLPEAETPTGGDQTPTGGDQTPTGGDQTPTGRSQTPTGGDQPPTGGDQPPTGEDQPPTGGDQNSTAGEEIPAP